MTVRPAGVIASTVCGVETIGLSSTTTSGGATAWSDWAITSVIDTSEEWRTVWKAVSAHRSQMSAYGALADLREEHHRALWGTQSFYRALSRVNGGPAVESDLFEGLR